MPFQSVNPATGLSVESIDEMSEDALLAALTEADVCFSLDWRRRSIAARAEVVSHAARLMRDRTEELAGHATREMGKLIDQARYEVRLSADILEYYAAKAEHFLRPVALADAPGSVIMTDPIGVILAIEPWNFPYYQLARVAGPQLVAGNVVMVKHAPNVPRCALAFAQLFYDAGSPTGAYTNLFCSVEQIGTLIDDFRIRGVTLTGSERAGAAVAERAGRKLKKAVLELGGSDPLIVLADADLEQAVDQAFAGRMLNMGQACAASKRIIVVGSDRGRQFLDSLTQRMRGLQAGDPSDPATTLGPLVSEKAMHELLRQVDDAVSHGARVITGGKRLDRPGFYVEPTILTDIKPDNPLHHEETFGPVASFYVVDTEEEAVALANDTRFGLGAAVFGGDTRHAELVASRIDCGMVFINSSVYTGPEVPFGGVKNSGYGRELGELGISEFVNRKLVRTATTAAS